MLNFLALVRTLLSALQALAASAPCHAPSRARPCLSSFTRRVCWEQGGMHRCREAGACLDPHSSRIESLLSLYRGADLASRPCLRADPACAHRVHAPFRN